MQLGQPIAVRRLRQQLLVDLLVGHAEVAVQIHDAADLLRAQEALQADALLELGHRDVLPVDGSDDLIRVNQQFFDEEDSEDDHADCDRRHHPKHHSPLEFGLPFGARAVFTAQFAFACRRRLGDRFRFAPGKPTRLASFGHKGMLLVAQIEGIVDENYALECLSGLCWTALIRNDDERQQSQVARPFYLARQFPLAAGAVAGLAARFDLARF